MGITVHRPKLLPMVEQAITKLTSRGVECSAADIFWLCEAGKEVYSPPGIDIHVLNLPVHVGDLALYPITLGAGKWWGDFALPWWMDNGRLRMLALVYALAHARDKSAFAEMTCYQKAYRTLLTLQQTIFVTETELQQAIDQVLRMGDEPAPGRTCATCGRPVEEETAEARRELDYGKVLALLCKECGGTPDTWLWDTPQKTVMSMLSNVTRMVHQPGQAPDPFDPFNRAHGRFLAVMQAIETDWRMAHPKLELPNA